jgi:hypothetical protein
MELVLQQVIASSGLSARINNQLVPCEGNLCCNVLRGSGRSANRTATTFSRFPSPWPTIKVEGQPGVQVDAQKAARHLTERWAS